MVRHPSRVATPRFDSQSNVSICTAATTTPLDTSAVCPALRHGRDSTVQYFPRLLWFLLVSCAQSGPGAPAADTFDPDTQPGDTQPDTGGEDTQPADTQDDTEARSDIEHSDTSDVEIAPSDTSDIAQETDSLDPWTAPVDPFDWPVLPLTIELDELGQALIELNPQSVAIADVVIADHAPLAARVTLAAEVGFDAKPSLVVRFGAEADEVHFGTTGLVLDAMTDDPSQMRTRLVHLLAKRHGVEVPRATHAVVKVGELELGLYTVTEPVTSPGFLERIAGTTAGSVFTSRDRNDLWPWQVVDYLRLSGDEADRDGLMALADAMEVFRLARLQGAPVPLSEALGGRVDLQAFVDAMALQVTLGHWSGYARSTMGFGLHVTSGDVARVTFLPVALGQSLAAGDAPNPWLGGGKLVGQCHDDPDCRASFGDALERLSGPAVAREMVTLASELRLVIGSAVAADTRRGTTIEDVRAATDELLWTLEQQPGWIAANLACTNPSEVDADGDGFSVCLDDCDDDHDDVYPGAKERCNLRDDDCDGVLDDDPECPDCVEVDGPREGQTWWLCHAPRTWNEARARCAELGGEFASILNEHEHTAFLRATLGHQWTNWWLGLSDQESEGTFVWADGEAASFTFWSSGEPNDSAGREDCAQLIPWNGRWNDLDCARRLPFVCQQAR